MNIQATYATRIQLGVDGSMIDVSVNANNVWQSKKIIESICGSIKIWQIRQNSVSN